MDILESTSQIVKKQYKIPLSELIKQLHLAIPSCAMVTITIDMEQQEKVINLSAEWFTQTTDFNVKKQA